MKPTIGRIVHYHTIDTGKVVPAIVVDILDGDHVDLFIMCSGRVGTQLEVGTFFERNVLFTEVKKPGCWSWPPRV